MAMMMVASCVSSARAASLESMPLEDVLALASGARPIPPSGSITLSEVLFHLDNRPAASPEEEAKIVATMNDLIWSSNGNSSGDAVRVLARRGHVEIIPRLFAAIETHPRLFGRFFSERLQQRGAPPDEMMLRVGLRSEVADARQCMIDLIAGFKIAGFRSEVEALLETDPSALVRRQAASALRKVGTIESAGVLQRVLERDPTNVNVFFALRTLGGDAQVPSLLRLLNHDDAVTRSLALGTLAEMNVVNPAPLVQAFMTALEEEPDWPPLSAASGLARYHDERALPFLRRIADFQQRDNEDDDTCVSAIVNIGGPKATALLNSMLAGGWRSRGGIEQALAKLGDPASARVAWAAYLEHPVRMNISGWCAVTRGYTDALKVVEACADRELLETVRARALETTERSERGRLNRAVKEIERRLVEQASAAASTPAAG